MNKLTHGISEYSARVRSFKPNARWFLLGNLCVGFGLSIFVLLFNLYLKELGFTEDFIGRVLSFGSFGLFLAALPSAYIAKRYAVRSVLLVSAALVSLGYFFQAIVLEPNGLIVACFITGGITVVSRILSAPFFMRNSTPAERSHLFASSMAINVLAGVLGNLLGGYLPFLFQSFGCDFTFSLRLSLITGASFSLLGAAPFFFIREGERVLERVSFGQLVRAKRGKVIAKLCLPYALVGAGAGFVIPFLNLYFSETFNSTSGEIGVYFAALQGMMVIGFLSGPIFSKKFGMIRTIVGSQLLSIPFMLILALAPSLPLAVGAFLIRGMLMNMNMPIQGQFNMEIVDPEDREVTNSYTMLAWNGAWAISSSLGGIVIHQYSFSLSFYVTIGLYVLSSLIYYLFFHKEEQKLRKGQVSEFP